MIHSFWGNGYPILINPEFQELERITSEKWDTLRVCVEGENIGIASGYGNTHQSVIDAMKSVLKVKRLHPETYIIFKEDGEFWFNLEDVNGERKVPYKKVLREYFSEKHSDILFDLITNYGYAST